MAFDACMMRAVLGEFRMEFPEAKIEKIYQPTADEIVMLIHYGKKQRRLSFNVGANSPRLQLTDTVKENPISAPMFCMFLRKRLIGAKIISAEQAELDRIAIFKLSCYDEMGFAIELRLICEIMGKYANLILTDSDGKIINALKLVDFSASEIRQILPGLKYTLPEQKPKASPLSFDEEGFLSALSAFGEERPCEKLITAYFSGVATQIARELVFRASGDSGAAVGEVDRDKLVAVIRKWQRILCEEDYTPTLVLAPEGNPKDYSYMDIGYLGNACKKQSFDSLRELFDVYFAERDRIERIKARSSDVRGLLSAAISRTERKLSLQRETLLQSERGEDYKRIGDLITSNLYMIPKGADSFECVDYYSEDCPLVKIELDSRLSPSANAQKMYKLYNKAKTAKRVLTEQIAIWEHELLYLESVSAFLDNAECEQDINDIRDELYSSGYASRMRSYRPKSASKPKPITMTTSGGFTLYIGRNNIENDKLTFKIADKGDLWFHTKDIPGSHVIMVTDGVEPSAQDYTEACEIAAGYSKAKGDSVAVDYTFVKNIKKPAGAKPGFVIYKTNYTAFVKPKKKIQA